MIKAIPYLGKDNNDYIKAIKNSKIRHTVDIDLYSFIIEKINNNELKNQLVIINNKYLTYLQDIKFNYRDNKLVLPYWEYDLHKITKEEQEIDNELSIKLNKFQYLINDKHNKYYVRYNYKYKEIYLKEGTKLILYDLEYNYKYKVNIKSITNLTEFSIEYLYKLYIESSYNKDDSLLVSNQKGYYFIDKVVKGLYNKELKLRGLLELNTFNKDTGLKLLDDYRDVRNFKKEEVQSKFGLIETIECYKYRRLRFDALLYCIINNELKSDNPEFNKELQKLGKTKNIIKYGDNIKLIFKSYWLKEYKHIKQQSWMKVQVK